MKFHLLEIVPYICMCTHALMIFLIGFFCFQIKSRIEMLRNQEKLLIEEMTSKNLESQHLEEEYNLLKSAMEMEFDDQHPVDLYIEQLNERIEAGKRNLVELESQW